MKCSLAVAYPTALSTAPFLFRGDWREIIAQAGRCGYDGVELHLRRPAEMDGQALRACAREQGLQFSALATGMSYTMDGLCLIAPEAAGRAAALERLKQYIDLAQQLGCIVILGSIRGNLPAEPAACQQAMEWFTAALCEALDYAAPKGVTLAVEAINRYENNYFNTLDELSNFIRALGRPNLKAHADSFHMNIEESDWERAFRNNSDVLGYVHVADNNRHFLGGGMLDTRRFASALHTCGYDGWVSLECLPLPSAQAAAEQSLPVMRRICANYR